MLGFLLFGLSNFTYSQDKGKVNESKTKMDAITSKTCSLIKSISYEMPVLPTKYEIDKVNNRVMVITTGGVESFFYQMEDPDERFGATASIEYSDLLKIINAIEMMKSEVVNDVQTNSDRINNMFMTDDGFAIGYDIKKGKTTWFIFLSRRSEVFFDSIDNVEQSMKNAKNKIEELKNK